MKYLAFITLGELVSDTCYLRLYHSVVLLSSKALLLVTSSTFMYNELSKNVQYILIGGKAFQ